MPKSTANKVERGTKRTCQNPECGSRFYDLGRDPIICPICNTAYKIELAKPDARAWSAKAYQKPVKRIVEIKPEATEPDALPVIEDEEEETVVVADEDETIIEEEDDGSPDVLGIIDAPIDREEKT